MSDALPMAPPIAPPTPSHDPCARGVSPDSPDVVSLPALPSSGSELRSTKTHPPETALAVGFADLGFWTSGAPRCSPRAPPSCSPRASPLLTPGPPAIDILPSTGHNARRQLQDCYRDFYFSTSHFM